MASMVKSRVMTFVTLAGSSFSCSFLENRTVPVSFSISSAEGADTSSALAGMVSSSAAASANSSFFITLPLFLLSQSMRKGKNKCASGHFSSCKMKQGLLYYFHM